MVSRVSFSRAWRVTNTASRCAGAGEGAIDGSVLGAVRERCLFGLLFYGEDYEEEPPISARGIETMKGDTLCMDRLPDDKRPEYEHDQEKNYVCRMLAYAEKH
jgi:hypothetical protein